MVIIWGTKLYGKCDEVPGLCFVGTQFFHLWYIPLIPLGSYAIRSEDGDGFQGMQIPMSFKSVLMGWIRAACVVGIIGGIIGFIANDRPTQAAVRYGCLAEVVGSIGLMFASYKLGFLRTASYERAKEIGQHMGLTEEGEVLLDLAYGRTDEFSAKTTLDKLNKKREREEAAQEARKEARREERAARREEDGEQKEKERKTGTTRRPLKKREDRET